MEQPPIRLGIFVTHPIQYFAPVWRLLAANENFQLSVYFFSDHSVRGGVDPEFGVNVAWDIPLLDGYAHTFLERSADLSKPWSVALPNAREILTRDRLDVVLVHGYTHRFEHNVVKAARKSGVATVIRGEFSDSRPPRGWSAIRNLMRDTFLKRFYRKIDSFCYMGQLGKQHLERLGIPGDRMFFAPYSVDTALFERQKQQFQRVQVRADLGIPADATVLLFSGKLVPRKAPLLLVEAVRRLGNPESIFLVLVGEGEQRAEVEAAARAALGSRFLMPGFVNQSGIGRYYAAADVLVLPSLFDTWGLVVNEAMQFGLPVVVSDRVGCAPDLLVEGTTGYTFSSSDAASLAKRLNLLIEDPERIRSMGQHASRHVERYSASAAAAGIRLAVLDAFRHEDTSCR
ncbi:MAG: glycosyltransferase family 4 protein [Planctomycetota bacterium]